VTMSMHKLTAGSGYDYLTRQVAALDATDKGHVGLADYYSAKGWVCQSDLAPLGGLVLARCGPTLDHRFPSTFGSSAKAIRRGEGLEGEIESGAVRRYPT
jgi:hypothetical protein